ncbi:MAG: hypothetical protein ACODAG_06225 [Myxococcota bacterium]
MCTTCLLMAGCGEDEVAPADASTPDALGADADATADAAGDPCEPNPCLNDGICDGDGAEVSCECPDGYAGSHCAIAVKPLAAGGFHSCAVIDTGDVRCWGNNTSGELGYGHTDSVGDEETPYMADDLVELGGRVAQLTAGNAHTCALLESGEVYCWGGNSDGRLGYGHTQNIGDNESVASAGAVDVGGSVVQISAGSQHTCALLNEGNVRCWGDGEWGALGYGNTDNVGDDKTPAEAGDVDVGGRVIQVAAGGTHTCALLESGGVKCWGFNVRGQLGYPELSDDIGADLPPSDAEEVDVGGTVVEIATGHSFTNWSHTCARMASGSVRCWGYNASGQLGYGHDDDIGDDETPADAGDVPLGGTALRLGLGHGHTCAVLEGGALRCWGSGQHGKLGYGSVENVGIEDTPADAGDVDVGGSVRWVTAGSSHTCAGLKGDLLAVRCWGQGDVGALGYGNTDNIGDSEDNLPRHAGNVPLQ